MPDKNQLIIENAINLFSKKSISLTSVQDIATESGISKGAFYLHFKSKDALLVAIINFYSEMIEEHIHNTNYTTLTPRQQYSNKLTDLFEAIMEHKEFILVQLKDPVIALTDEMTASLKKVNGILNQFHQSYLLQIYGDQAKAHLWDLTFMIDGLFSSYLKFMIYAPVIELRHVVDYVLKRMDNIVEGLQSQQALLNDELINPFLSTFFENQDGELHVPLELTKLRTAIEELDKKEELLVSIHMLEEECSKQEPRHPIIQGMLLNLKGEESLRPMIHRLVAYYHLDDSLFTS